MRVREKLGEETRLELCVLDLLRNAAAHNVHWETEEIGSQTHLFVLVNHFQVSTNCILPMIMRDESAVEATAWSVDQLVRCMVAE